MFDVVALGELLIDFTPVGKTENDNPSFEQNSGGAPANVLASLARLGKRTAFIGKVGHDAFGIFLEKMLQEYDIHTEGLVLSNKTPTTLAFVHLDDTGDRSFSFYRNPGADMMLEKNEVNYELIKRAKVFHFGSLSMTDSPAREATLAAVRFAKAQNVLVSFDPNLRESLWSDLEIAKERMKEGLALADIVKISDEELVFLTGESELTKGAEMLQREYNIPYLFVTLGAKGCYYLWKGMAGTIPGFKVAVQDTTGAGDAFLGGILYNMLKISDLDNVTQAAVKQIVTFANATGALATTRKGAFVSMPKLEEITSLVEERQSEVLK